MKQLMGNEVGILMYERQVMITNGNEFGADKLEEIINRKVKDNIVTERRKVTDREVELLCEEE